MSVEGWDFEAFLDDIDDDEIAQRIRDAASLILAGLDQAHSELEMPWKVCSWGRMKMLSERIAVETADWTKYDGLLVGTWMAATSRTQILADDGAAG